MKTVQLQGCAYFTFVVYKGTTFTKPKSFGSSSLSQYVNMTSSKQTETLVIKSEKITKANDFYFIYPS